MKLKLAFFLSIGLIGALVVLKLPVRLGGRPASTRSGALPAERSPMIQPLTAAQLKEKLVEQRSGVTLLNVWATWCTPCKDEIPDLLALRTRFAKRGFRLLLASGDRPETVAAAEEFLQKNAVDFPTYRLSEEPDVFIKPFIKQWPAVLPTSLLFSADGKKLESWMGRRIDPSSLAHRLDALLKAAKPGDDLASPVKIGSDQGKK